MFQLLLLGGVVSALAHRRPLDNQQTPDWLLGGAHQVRRRVSLFALARRTCATTPLTLSDPISLPQRCSAFVSPYFRSWSKLGHESPNTPRPLGGRVPSSDELRRDSPQVRIIPVPPARHPPVTKLLCFVCLRTSNKGLLNSHLHWSAWRTLTVPPVSPPTFRVTPRSLQTRSM